MYVYIYIYIYETWTHFFPHIYARVKYYFFKLWPLSLCLLLLGPRRSYRPHASLSYPITPCSIPSIYIKIKDKNKNSFSLSLSLSLSVGIKEWENQKDFICRTTFSDSIRYFLISNSKCPFCFVGSYHIYSILILFLCVYWFRGSKLNFATWVLINFLVWFNFD